MWLNVSLWEWIFLFLCILIILIYITIQCKAPNIEKYILGKNPFPDADNVFKYADNGDIILMSGDTRGDRICKWFSNTIFSHVGILFRENHPKTGENVLYIWDCDIGQRSREGPRVMRLDNKLKYYKGFKIAGWKKLITLNFPFRTDASRPRLERILKIVSEYTPMLPKPFNDSSKGIESDEIKSNGTESEGIDSEGIELEHSLNQRPVGNSDGIEFDNKMMTWWVADFPVLYNIIKNTRTMFCSEMVASTLQDLNILKRDRPAAWYHPGDFHTGRLFLREGYSYGETMFFRF